MATKSRNRNYSSDISAEFRAVEAAGKSRAQARGHARARDLVEAQTKRPLIGKARSEIALRLMKEGRSQKKRPKLPAFRPKRSAAISSRTRPRVAMGGAGSS